jgi:hypothetical protein
VKRNKKEKELFKHSVDYFSYLEKSWSKMPKQSRQALIEQEKQYVAFLKKRLKSDNYKANVSKEEYDKTKEKYDKAKFRLKTLTG